MNDQRRHILFTLLLVAALFFSGQAWARKVVDQTGRRVLVPDQPQRVISLAPAITEIVYALGREGRLAGVTRFADYPAAAAKLPRVGTYIRPDLEKIIARRPDLCLATRDGNPKGAVEKLLGLGVPVFTINPRNIEEIMVTIRQLGEIMNAAARAEALVADMQRRVLAVTRATAGITRRPRVFFQIDVSPIVSSGSSTFIDELIRLAGGNNLAAGPNPYPRFSWEQLIRLGPEIVVITSMAGEQSARELQNNWYRWHDIPAVRTGRIEVVDANLFGRPTPRLIQGLEVLASLIHPELFESNNAD